MKSIQKKEKEKVDKPIIITSVDEIIENGNI
jgi:hypothetical protein